MQRKKRNSFGRVLAVTASFAMVASLGMPMTVYADDQSQSIQEAPSGGIRAQKVSGTVTAVEGADSYTLTSQANEIGQNINTVYGAITIDNSGNYVYTLNPIKLRGIVKCSLDGNGIPYVDPNGSFDHLPVQDTPLTDTVSVSADVGGSPVDAGSIDISIQGVNYAPYAFGTPDMLNLSEDGVTTASGSLINVFSDDEGFGNLTFTVNGSTSSTGTFGTLTLNADGTYEYDLDNAAAQEISAASPVSQSFTITAADKRGATASATLNLTISGEDDTSEISSQYTYINQNGLTGMFVYRDVDYASRGTSIASVASAGGGTVAFNDGGAAWLSDIGTFQLSLVQPSDPSMSDWEWYSFTITPDVNVQTAILTGQSATVNFQFNINDGTNQVTGPSLPCSIQGTGKPVITPTATATPTATPKETPIVPVPQPQDVRPAPELTINYEKETINCTAEMEYSIGAGMVWQPCSDNMSISSFGWDGTFAANVYFRYKATLSQSESDAIEIVFKTRPAAPSLSVSTLTESVSIPAGYSYGADPNNISTPGAASVSMNPESSIYIVKNATSEDFRSLIGTVTAPKRSAVPTVSINYSAETMNVSLPTQYSLDGGKTYHDCISGMPAVSLGWNGNNAITVLFRNPASDTQYHSDSQTLVIPARPGKPSVTTKNESKAGKKDGEINGVSAAMEVRSSGSAGWTPCSGTTFGGLSAGSYQVRIRATGSGFCSSATDCAIADQSGSTRILSVDNIVFTTAEYGYAPYAQQTFRIKNSGNSDATISNFWIEGSDDFDLQGLKGAGVPAGYELDNWSVAPKTGLAPGTHTGTMVLVYDNGAVCTATLAFTVTRANQTAPSAPVLDSVTENSIAVKEIPASTSTGAVVVYSIDGGWTWQDSTVFSNLNSGVTYSIIARYAKTDSCNPSAASAALSVTTVKSSVTPGGNPTPGTNPSSPAASASSSTSPASPTASTNPSGSKTSNLPFILIIGGVVAVAAAAIVLVLVKGKKS